MFQNSVFSSSYLINYETKGVKLYFVRVLFCQKNKMLPDDKLQYGLLYYRKLVVSFESPAFFITIKRFINLKVVVITIGKLKRGSVLLQYLLIQ